MKKKWTITTDTNVSLYIPVCPEVPSYTSRNKVQRQWQKNLLLVWLYKTLYARHEHLKSNRYISTKWNFWSTEFKLRNMKLFQRQNMQICSPVYSLEAFLSNQQNKFEVLLHRPSLFFFTKWHTDKHCCLTLILLMCRIWWAPNNASRWQMGFNSVLLNDAVNCKDCIVSTAHIWNMSMECWWNDNGKGILQYLQKNLSQWHSVHQKSHWLTDLWSNPGLHHHRLATESWYYTLNTHTQSRTYWISGQESNV